MNFTLASVVAGSKIQFTPVEVLTKETISLKVDHNSAEHVVNHVWFIYLFGVLRRFPHCTGHITTGNFMGRGNQYIQLVKVLYCKLPTNGKQLPAFPLEVDP